jgi:hypothetical protein
MIAVDVLIPPDKTGVIQSADCVRWLVEQASAGVHGDVIDGQFFLRFEDAEDAKRFRERWLGNPSSAAAR